MPEISIVLPIYNGAKYVRESIDSIIAQTYTDWELIIVDDCSSDKTPDIISEYAKADERIKVITNRKNMKLPASLNTGFSTAQGKFYTWTSDDNLYEPRALEEMHTYMLNNPSNAMVVADMTCFDDESKEFISLGDYDATVMGYGNVVGACFLYRASVKQIVGEYDEGMFLVEDYEYWLRILFYYGRIGHIDERLYKYRMHGNSLTAQKSADIKEQLYYLRLKYYGKLLELMRGNDYLLYKFYYEMFEKRDLTTEQREEFFKYCPVMQGEETFLLGKQTFIYGAGKFGTLLPDYISNVVGYIDGDIQKIGTCLNGRKIMDIKSYLGNISSGQLVIAINDGAICEVIRDLKRQGINRFCTLRGALISLKLDYSLFESEANQGD